MTKLDELTVQELQELRSRVQKELADRASKAARLENFYFCPSDDRSYGELRFEADTPHGRLAYKADVGHGGFDREVLTLDGEPEKDIGLRISEGSFSDGTTEEEARERAADAVRDWVQEYGEWLEDG